MATGTAGLLIGKQ